MHDARHLVRLSWFAAFWGLAYTIYRGYYAAGGTAGLPGEPGPASHFRLINAVAAVILLIAAVLPIAMLPLWRFPAVRRLLLLLCWFVAVLCTMHALIDMIDRVQSLTGHLRIELPAGGWTTYDSRKGDLQDLFGNEPWFLVEGLLFAALAWVNLARRRWWTISAVAAVAVLTVAGVLAANGVIGRAVIF